MLLAITMLREQPHCDALLYRRSLIKSMPMARVSTARKLGIATRIASQQVRRTRTFGAIVNAGRATAAHMGRVLSQLWLEVTGFVFLALGGIGLLAFFREYGKYHAGHGDSGRVVLAVCFALLFGWFGLSSFWRVRRKS